MNLWAREPKMHVCYFFILSAGRFLEDNLNTWSDISCTSPCPFTGTWIMMSEMSLFMLIALLTLLGEQEQVI